MIISIAATILATGQLTPTPSAPEYDVVFVNNFDPAATGLVAREVNNSGVVLATGPELNFGGIWKNGKTTYDDFLLSGKTQARKGSSTSYGAMTYTGISNNGTVTGFSSVPEKQGWYQQTFGLPEPTGTDGMLFLVFRKAQGQTIYPKPAQPLNPWASSYLDPNDYMPDTNSKGEFAVQAQAPGARINGRKQADTIFYRGNNPLVVARTNSRVFRTIPVDLNDHSDLLTAEEEPTRSFATVRKSGGTNQELQALNGAQFNRFVFKGLYLPPFTAFENVPYGSVLAAPAVYPGPYIASAIGNDSRVVGGAVDKNGFFRATVWSNGEPTTLQNMPSYDSSQACRIADNGTIVGVVWNRTPAKKETPPWVIWSGGKSYFLNDCIDKRHGVKIAGVVDMSDNGIILAGLDYVHQGRRYVLLIPKGLNIP